jgi:hypothetical protein
MVSRARHDSPFRLIERFVGRVRRVDWLCASERRAHGVSMTLRPQRGRPPGEGPRIRFSEEELEVGQQVR